MASGTQRARRCTMHGVAIFGGLSMLVIAAVLHAAAA